MLDATPEVDGLGLRPARGAASATWFVEDETGKRYDLETVRQRVYGLANALAGAWGVREGDVGALRLTLLAPCSVFRAPCSVFRGNSGALRIDELTLGTTTR